MLTPHLTAPDRGPGGAQRARDPALRDLQPGLPRRSPSTSAPSPSSTGGRRRLYRECLHEVERGLFVDQRWMDFAPAFLPGAVILRDPGYNVAYWNLAHRRIAGGGRRLARPRRAGGDDVPLRFFHFSGYDFRRPELISKFQNRFTFADRPDVAPLFQLYGERVARRGAGDGPGLPLPVRPLRQRRAGAGGRPPHPAAGRSRGEGAGPIRSPPAGGSFFDWLRQPAGDLPSALPLPRLALILWDHRQDLAELLPPPLAGGPRPLRRLVRRQHRRAGEHRSGVHRPGADATPLAPRSGGELTAERRVRRSGRWPISRRSSTAGSYEPAGRLDPAEIAWLTADAGHEPGAAAAGAAAGARDAPPPARPPALLSRSARGGPRGARPLVLDLRTARVPAAPRGRPPRAPHPALAPARLGAPLVAEAADRRELAAAPPGAGGGERSCRPRRSGPEGISVIGWATAPTGVGEACRGLSRPSTRRRSRARSGPWTAGRTALPARRARRTARGSPTSRSSSTSTPT